MSRCCCVLSFFLPFALLSFALAQSQPASDPVALSFAAQSIAALTGGNAISDATLTGSVTWNAASDTGTATLRALGTGESRMDLALTSGTRTEIRDSQTGAQLGRWSNPNGTSGNFAAHNCMTDAVWFFPPLTSLSSGTNVVLTYVGQENRNGGAVQHIRSYVYEPDWPVGLTPNAQQLSTMDFYLDAASLLPLALTFNAHPDDDANTNLPAEVDFSNYQTIAGVNIPTRVQKYQQGSLMIDLTISGASFNSGLSNSIFAINQ